MKSNFIRASDFRFVAEAVGSDFQCFVGTSVRASDSFTSDLSDGNFPDHVEIRTIFVAAEETLVS